MTPEHCSFYTSCSLPLDNSLPAVWLEDLFPFNTSNVTSLPHFPAKIKALLKIPPKQSMWEQSNHPFSSNPRLAEGDAVGKTKLSHTASRLPLHSWNRSRASRLSSCPAVTLHVTQGHRAFAVLHHPQGGISPVGAEERQNGTGNVVLGYGTQRQNVSICLLQPPPEGRMLQSYPPHRLYCICITVTQTTTMPWQSPFRCSPVFSLGLGLFTSTSILWTSLNWGCKLDEKVTDVLLTLLRKQIFDRDPFCCSYRTISFGH